MFVCRIVYNLIVLVRPGFGQQLLDCVLVRPGFGQQLLDLVLVRPGFGQQLLDCVDFTLNFFLHILHLLCVLHFMCNACHHRTNILQT